MDTPINGYVGGKYYIELILPLELNGVLLHDVLVDKGAKVNVLTKYEWDGIRYPMLCPHLMSSKLNKNATWLAT